MKVNELIDVSWNDNGTGDWEIIDVYFEEKFEGSIRTVEAVSPEKDKMATWKHIIVDGPDGREIIEDSCKIRNNTYY